MKTAKSPPTYDFIDILGTNMKKKNIWFSKQYAAKSQRDAFALQAAEEHRQQKKKAWNQFLKNAHVFWIERVIWKIIMFERAWGLLEVTWPTDKTMAEIMKIASFEAMKCPENFWRYMHDLA